MTNATEAKLAREAELCYATIAMATDYDCWHEEEDNVNADMIIQILLENAEKAKNIIKESIGKIDFAHNECGTDGGGKNICGCVSLQKSVVTAKKDVPEETLKNCLYSIYTIK
jgi:Purine nucleoside phosphorylase